MQLLINDRVAPVDLEPGIPLRLRWRREGSKLAKQGGTETASYQVAVASTLSAAALGNGDIWDSSKCHGDGFDGVLLQGVPNEPSKRFWVSVRLWNNDDVPSVWSVPMTFGTGAGTHWQADAIWAQVPKRWGMPQAGDLDRGWALLHSSFTLPAKPICWATLNATGASTKPSRQFVYRLWLDGSFVGCGPVFPIDGETRYDGYDVTGLLGEGEHRIDVAAYALDDQRFASQLDVSFCDGEVMHLCSDSTWKAKCPDCVPSTDTAGEIQSVGTQYFVAPSERGAASCFLGDAPGCFRDADSWQGANVKARFAWCRATPCSKIELQSVPARVIHTIVPSQVLLDFGLAWVGGVKLRALSGFTAHITVRYAEVLDADGMAKYRLSAGNVYEDTCRFDGSLTGQQRWDTWGIRVFRYVQLIADDSVDLEELIHSGAFEVSAIALVHSQISHVAHFDSDNAVLNAVWELSAHTIEACNTNIYVDSWTRERAPYEADAWIQQQAHLTLDDDSQLGRYSIDYLIDNRTWPTEWPLYTILAVFDSWQHTGDDTQVRMRYQKLKKLLPERYIDPRSGFVLKDPGLSSQIDGDLVDWPESERDGFVFGRVNTVVNALASQAYADMASMAKHLLGSGCFKRVGKPSENCEYCSTCGVPNRATLQSDMQCYKSRAAVIRTAINNRLYDEKQHAYVDGLVDVQGPRIGHRSLHASAFALAYAQVPENRVEKVCEYLRSRGMACSVYAAATYLDALYRAGHGADADVLMAQNEGMRTWANMLHSGAGGTMEAWDLSLKLNTTYSHPWAASPLYLIARGMAGIRALEPGYRRFAVIPQLGSARCCSITMPVRTGDITLTCQYDDGSALLTSLPSEHINGVNALGGAADSMSSDCGFERLQMSIEVPDRTSATVVVPVEFSLQADRQDSDICVVVDAEEVVASRFSAPQRVAGVLCPKGSVQVPNLLPGRHYIEVRVRH